MLPTCRLTHSSRPYNRDTPGDTRNVLHLGALSVPSRIGGERITRTSLTVTRWFVTFGAHAWFLSSQFTVWQAFCCCCFCVRIFFARLGLPMETLLGPCWGIVPEGLLGYIQAMTLPTNKDFRIFLRLCRAQATNATSPKQNYVMMHLQHQDQRGTLMLFPGNLLGSRMLHTLGKK